MKLLRTLKLYWMLGREWERVRKKDWFQRLEETPLELEQTRMRRLLRLAFWIHRGRPVTQNPILIRTLHLDKKRELADLPLDEQLLHGLLRQIVTESLEGRLSPQVHSFRKNHSVETALRDIEAALRRYRKNTPLENRALQVLRFDIKKCGESIPVHPSSRIWRLIEEAIPARSPLSREVLLSSITRAIRPEVCTPESSAPFQLRYGIPTGSPLQPMFLNLYLGEIDRYFEGFLSNSPHARYCRYGDDFLFFHPDEGIMEEACKGLRPLLVELEMSVPPEKMERFRLSGSGFQGRSAIEFLGMEVKFNGGIRINAEKQTELSRHLRHLIRKPFYELKGESLSIRIAGAKRLLDRAIRGKGTPRHPYVDRLLTLANDRSQLKEIDRLITTTLSREISGIRRASTFRSIPIQKLYRDYGIPSLTSERNRKWKS